MTYVKEFMKESLSKHQLTVDDRGIYAMKRPNTVVYSAYITNIANRICITGDVCVGGNDYGTVSAPGYSISWFAGRLSEGYLCSKFLRQEWQWEAAKEHILWHLEELKEEEWWMDRADKFKQFMSEVAKSGEDPRVDEFYELMIDLGDDGCDLPGYDYPRSDAGWLCAVQQTFAKLFQKMEVRVKCG